ncbi:hypothetical protein [Amycolatopsis sp.]|uniref:hypothetical protein n=1 Tax=Amycolatopsis sp. TaxID=37632 RepID=UPI0039C87BB3
MPGPKAGAAVEERDRIVVEPHAFVTTNTCFGRFPASYWQRWTEIGEVTIEAVVTGSGKLLVGASDSLGDQRVVASETTCGAVGRTFTAPSTGSSTVERSGWTSRPPSTS